MTAIAVAAPVAVPLVFGRDFADTVISVEVLSLSTLATALALVFSTIVTGRGRPALGSVTPAVGVLVTVVAFAGFWGSITSSVAAFISLASAVASLVVAIGLTAYVERSNRRAEQ